MENLIGTSAAWVLKIAEFIGMVCMTYWTCLHIKD